MTHRLLASCLLRLAPAPRVALVAATALLATGSAFAQAATGSISGRIYNPATREYVRNAQVRISGTDLLTESEADGSFTFSAVPAGTVTLTVTYTGYTAAPDTFTVTPGATAVREISIASTLAGAA
eukprot:gene45428-61551_t